MPSATWGMTPYARHIATSLQQITDVFYTWHDSTCVTYRNKSATGHMTYSTCDMTAYAWHSARNLQHAWHTATDLQQVTWRIPRVTWLHTHDMDLQHAWQTATDLQHVKQRILRVTWLHTHDILQEICNTRGKLQQICNTEHDVLYVWHDSICVIHTAQVCNTEHTVFYMWHDPVYVTHTATDLQHATRRILRVIWLYMCDTHRNRSATIPWTRSLWGHQRRQGRISQTSPCFSIYHIISPSRWFWEFLYILKYICSSVRRGHQGRQGRISQNSAKYQHQSSCVLCLRAKIRNSQTSSRFSIYHIISLSRWLLRNFIVDTNKMFLCRTPGTTR